MRILLVLLAGAATLFAQSPPSNSSTPGAQSIINSMLSSNSQATPPVATNPGKLPEIKFFAGAPVTASAGLFAQRDLASAPMSASPCSVPLIEARIRDDVHHTMQMIEPPSGKIDNMEITVPAPACSGSPR